MTEPIGDNAVIPLRSAHTSPPRAAEERDVLLSFLEFHRTVLVRKCAGLTAEQLDTTVAATSLTLGRLLRHMAFVEDHWFSFVLLGHDRAAEWLDADWDAQPDWEMDTAADHSPGELAEQFDRAVAASRSAVEGFALDRTAHRSGPHGPTNLRWILVHMIEEYARHCGHADLIREAIDGTVGD